MAKRKSAKNKNASKKAQTKAVSVTEDINDVIIAAALSAANIPVFLKVCRLCEAKDGPFLNIFNPDMITAKKIEAVLPFVITENDDLPHKICFRCSAKVEELYEFIQKCTQAQHNLRKAVGRKGSLVTKAKHRDLWEEKLNQSNISNDDICDALIKKAMEGIKDIPLSCKLFNEDVSVEKKTVNKVIEKEEPIKEPKVKEQEIKDQVEDLKLNPEEKTKEIQVKNTIENPKIDEVPVTRPKRAATKSNDTKKATIKKDKSSGNDPPPAEKKEKTKEPEEPKTDVSKIRDKSTELTISYNLEDIEPPTEKLAKKPFNIMEYMVPVTVSQLGFLFQCSFCERNFLNKEIASSHACATNRPSKTQQKPIVPPKLPLVKYINTRINSEPKIVNDKPITLDDEDNDDIPLSTKKPKPKIGPASKIKRNSVVEAASSNHDTVPPVVEPNGHSPVLLFPGLPSLNSRYKLMPGPNNTFTLVEEKTPETAISAPATPEKVDPQPVEPSKTSFSFIGPKSFLNKDKPASRHFSLAPNIIQPVQNIRQPAPNISKPTSVSQPYPVGLFKSLPSTNNSAANLLNPNTTNSRTLAMKKHSYTIVQTGNPSKLLISTKPLPVEEPPRKRQRKPRRNEEIQDKRPPISDTFGDAANARNAELFTFINVDPLRHPSYVLPTDNIQESQISTSTNSKNNENNKELSVSKYTCNMCNEMFSREKKLLSHIQLHYNKMDEEDQKRAKNFRKVKT